MIPLFKVYMSPVAKNHVGDVLDSGYIAQGPKNDLFEQKLRKHFNHPYVATVNSCTSALHLAAHMLLKELEEYEREVIVSPLTCTAGIAPFALNGYKIKWADINFNDFNICLDDVERKLTQNTRVVSFVHWGGCSIDYYRLGGIQQRYFQKYKKPLYVIEDCAHAWGATYLDEPLGTQGHFAAYSCQAIKTLTTGDGGVLLSPDEQSNARTRRLRWFGLDRDNKQDFRALQDIEEAGYKFQMNDIAATIGLANLPHVNNLVHQQQVISMSYRLCITNPLIQLPQNIKESNPSWWLYTVKVNDRDKFIKWLSDHDISCSQVHTRNDRLSCFSEFNSKEPLACMDAIDSQYTCIPCGWWMSVEDVNHVIEVCNGYED